MSVVKFLRVVARATPSLVIGGRISLTPAEVKCVGMYAPLTRSPLGLSTKIGAAREQENVLDFDSREAALTWCIQRDLTEESCCTMPMIDNVDASMSRGVPTYMYKEPINRRMYLICNGNMVKLECCLLTSLIWRRISVICPPKVSELMLSKADREGKR